MNRPGPRAPRGQQRSPLVGLFKRLPHALALSWRQLLHVVLVRYCVALVRYLYFVKVRRRLRVFSASGAAVAGNTVAHNFRGLVDLSVARSETLIRPLSVIDRVAQHADRLRVLCVGPRTEGELLNLLAYGFRWKNLAGLDLISYSPKVDLGDMHAMPYPDGSWDVILLGWVLAYSDDRPGAAREVIRVARDGALVAVGVEYSPRSNEEVSAELGYLPGSADRITGVDQILAWFEPAVETVYVRHDVHPSRRDRTGSIYTVFSIRKAGPGLG